MKSIEVKGTARTIAERSSEQARALKAIRKNNGVPCVLYGGGENIHFTVPADGLLTWFTLRTSTWLTSKSMARSTTPS